MKKKAESEKNEEQRMNEYESVMHREAEDEF
jgi:hypothetical protein